MTFNKAAKIMIAAMAVMLVFSNINIMADEHKKSENEQKSSEKVKKEENKKKPQTTCPVMGGKINKDIYADYEGKRVYFCCKSCVAKFKEDPEKYIKKLEKENVKIKDISKPQEICPVMGGKIDKEIYSDYQGQRVYFCCPSCVDKFKENPEKYIEKLKKEHVRIKDVRKPQETCPVMGGKIDKSIHADYEGKRVYFCCQACVSKFEENPEKYLQKMREKGEKPEEIKDEKAEKKEKSEKQ